jgi:hypothetical protein
LGFGTGTAWVLLGFGDWENSSEKTFLVKVFLIRKNCTDLFFFDSEKVFLTKKCSYFLYTCFDKINRCTVLLFFRSFWLGMGQVSS